MYSAEISELEHKAIRPILLGKTESDCRDVPVRAKFGSPAHRRHEKAAAVDGSRRFSICLVDSAGIFWIFYTRLFRSVHITGQAFCSNILFYFFRFVQHLLNLPFILKFKGR